MALDPFAPIRLGFRIGIGVVRLELRIVEKLLGLDREEPESWTPPREPEPAAFYSEPSPPPEPEPEPEEREPVIEAVEERPAFEAEAPEHLDVEPELVAEFAEPGAEEGAGPEIHVDEPWDGYRKMRVADIRDRVQVADPAELAVVQLYESMNRGRASILDAVERRSKELANLPR
jgi:hypothetical protein